MLQKENITLFTIQIYNSILIFIYLFIYLFYLFIYFIYIYSAADATTFFLSVRFFLTGSGTGGVIYICVYVLTVGLHVCVSV